MKTVGEIKEEIIYLKGYIAGQRNSNAPYDAEIERVTYEINRLKWVLEDSINHPTMERFTIRQGGK